MKPTQTTSAPRPDDPFEAAVLRLQTVKQKRATQKATQRGRGGRAGGSRGAGGKVGRGNQVAAHEALRLSERVTNSCFISA